MRENARTHTRTHTYTHTHTWREGEAQDMQSLTKVGEVKARPFKEPASCAQHPRAKPSTLADRVAPKPPAPAAAAAAASNLAEMQKTVTLKCRPWSPNPKPETRNPRP